MKKYLSLLLRKADYFNQKIQLYFNDEKRFGTCWGGFLSIIIYSLIISFTSVSLSDLFGRKNPMLSMTNTYFKDAPLLNMSELQMIYASYFMTGDFVPFSDPAYFTYSIFQFIVKRDNNGSQNINTIPLQMIKCSEYEEFYKEKGLEKEYKMNNIDKFGICFNTADVLLGGSFEGHYFSNLLYTLEKCKNRTDSEIKCKSEEEINEKLRGGYFQFYYVEKNIDTNNYENPFSNYFHSFFILLDPKTTQFIDIYIKFVNITSDVGFVFEEIQSTSQVVFDYFRDQFLYSTADEPLIKFYVNSSNNKLVYNRIYQKFQEFAATIGGILKAFFFVGYLLTSFQTEFKMYDYMINLLFHINDEEELRKKSIAHVEGEIKEVRNLFKDFQRQIAIEVPKKKSFNNLLCFNSEFTKVPDFSSSALTQVMCNNKKLNKGRTILSDKRFDDLSESKNILVNSINLNNSNKLGGNIKCKLTNRNPSKEVKDNLNEKIKNYRSKLKKKFSLDFFSLISIFICKYCDKKSAKKYKYFDVAFSKLNKYLDYLRIIKTLQEFHKLKKILFTKNQRNLFSVLNIPIIDEEKVKNYKFENNKENQEEMQLKYYEIFKSYSVAQEKSGNNKIYRKLMDNFDDRLKVIFENLEKK